MVEGSSDQSFSEYPHDLALHIIEVNGDGEGDEVDRSDLPAIEQPKAKLCDEAEAVDQKSEDDDAIVLREQFKCVIKEAIAKHKGWRDQNKNSWPCSIGGIQPLCLVFYFNGGRNSKAAAIGSAGRTYKEIENTGMYPIYMVWPTGDLQSYWEDWSRVRAGRLTKRTDPSTLATFPARPVSDLLRGLASTPAAWATSLFEFYQTGLGMGSEAYMMKRDWELHVSDGKPITTGEKVEIKPNQNLYFSSWEKDLHFRDSDAPPDGEPKADLQVQNGVAARTKQVGDFVYHGAIAPVRVLTTWPMVGLGEAGWRNMVRRTRTSVRSAAEFPEFAEAVEDGGGPDEDQAVAAEIDCPLRAGGHLEEREKLEGNSAMLRRCYPRGSGGFARVFQWLESCMTGQAIAEGADDCPLTDLDDEDRKTLGNARIVMIGHSMGTIVINELLQLFPDLPYETLVYMAGAASIRDTSRAVTRVLVNNRGCTKFYGLMLHPMNEARESTFYGLLPSGSLLVYVDEFLEVPKTVPDRTVGQWRNLRATQHVFFPEQARRWMMFHVYDWAEGKRPLGNGKYYRNPTTHGAFNDEDVFFWQEAFWKPEQVEFREPQADCNNLFTSRLNPAEIHEEATRTQEWQRILHEVEMGKTFVIRGDGGIVARIVPVPARDQDDAHGVAH